RHESVFKTLQRGSHQTSTGKHLCCISRFELACSGCAEYYPMEFAIWIFLGQSQNRSTTSDLNIVGGGAQAQDFETTIPPAIQVQVDHPCADVAFGSCAAGFAIRFHTFHGALPWFNSSRCCLSLN